MIKDPKVIFNIKPSVDNSFVWGNSCLAVFDTAEKVNAEFKLPVRNRTLLLMVCIRGELKVVYDTKSLILNSQSIMVLLPGHFIQDYNLSLDFEGYMISLSLSSMTNISPLMSRILICSLHYKDNPVIHLDENEIENQIMFRDLLRHKLSHAGDQYDLLVINKICEAIFYETLNDYTKRVHGSVDTKCGRSETLFYRFIIEIENNFKCERAVSYYADKLCVSPKHLSAVVKETSGRTAGEWIDYYVVNEIKRLLTTTDLSMNEISCKLHFVNQSFFGKYFKTNVGVSPREYRNKSLL